MTCHSDASSESEALGSAGSRTSPCRWAVPFRMVMHSPIHSAIRTLTDVRMSEGRVSQVGMLDDRRHTGLGSPPTLVSLPRAKAALRGTGRPMLHDMNRSSM